MTLREWLRWRWACVTCHWFFIHWHCARKGHQWRTEFCPGSREGWAFDTCGWCGKFRGWRLK